MSTAEEMPSLARAPSTKRKAAPENQENSAPVGDNVQLRRDPLESRPSKKKLKAGAASQEGQAAPAAAAPAAAEAPPKAASSSSPPAQPAAAQDEAGLQHAGAKPSEAGCDSKSGFWSLPDWCDRPLYLKENLLEDEDVQRYNYIAGVPLVAVAAEGKDRLVGAILRHGGDVDVQDNHGNTALHLAAAHGRTHIVDTLLIAGARQLPNKKELRPLDYAVKGDFQEIVELLQENTTASAAAGAP